MCPPGKMETEIPPAGEVEARALGWPGGWHRISRASLALRHRVRDWRAGLRLFIRRQVQTGNAQSAITVGEFPCWASGSDTLSWQYVLDPAAKESTI